MPGKVEEDGDRKPVQCYKGADFGKWLQKGGVDKDARL